MTAIPTSTELMREVLEEVLECNRAVWSLSPQGMLYIKRVEAALASPRYAAQEAPRDGLLHPTHQVYFRAGLIACREYMARFVEAESPTIAMSIRANWWPSLGSDFGPPRQLDWSEITSGEYGTPSFRVKTVDEVSPTQEALPVAAGFLALLGVQPASSSAPPVDVAALRALSAQWRVKSDDYERRKKENAEDRYEIGEASCRSSMLRLRDCADDLDRLLGEQTQTPQAPPLTGKELRWCSKCGGDTCWCRP